VLIFSQKISGEGKSGPNSNSGAALGESARPGGRFSRKKIGGKGKLSRRLNLEARIWVRWGNEESRLADIRAARSNGSSTGREAKEKGISVPVATK